MTLKSSSAALPLVSCLMVTANRKVLAKRAVHCFLQQTYPNKELVILDDGEQSYADILSEIPAEQLQYIRIKKESNQVLGSLRNLTLDKARGDFLVQWDDDDWYHPQRIEQQVSCLENGFDACCLSGTLMHMDDREFFHLPFVGYLPDGVPGSIMHRRDDTIRYPEYKRAEDTVYLNQWRKKRYKKMDAEHAGLFIRCYHGSNTWEQTHFKRRMRNSFAKMLRFGFYEYILRDHSKNPLFRLQPQVQQAFDLYLQDSRALDIFTNEIKANPK